MIESNPAQTVPDPVKRVYTRFGYGTALPHDSPESDPSTKMIKVQFRWKGTGYMPVNSQMTPGERDKDSNTGPCEALRGFPKVGNTDH